MEEEIELLLRLDYITGCPQSDLDESGIDASKFDVKETITNLINKNKELEKMVEIMGVDLMCCGADFVSFGMFTGNFKKDKELVIEHYKKKAKGE